MNATDNNRIRIVDLTRVINTEMPVFEKRIKPLTIPWSRLDVHGYDLELMFMSTHTGTHMDAPKHFNPKGYSIDDVPLSNLVSNAILVRVSKGADEYITKDDLKHLKDTNLDLRGKSIVISTGWEHEYNNSEYYLDRNPGLSKDAAEYIVDAGIIQVGIDTANIDNAKDSKFTAHHILLSNNITIVENLCNLDSIKVNSFTLLTLPLKLKGASGSPVRALALL
jgi:kynurenine formamidase